jgi:hypothetical protein
METDQLRLGRYRKLVQTEKKKVCGILIAKELCKDTDFEVNLFDDILNVEKLYKK